MFKSIFEGFGAAKEVLQNSKSIYITAAELRVLHGVLDLGVWQKVWLELVEFSSTVMLNRP